MAPVSAHRVQPCDWLSPVLWIRPGCGWQWAYACGRCTRPCEKRGAPKAQQLGSSCHDSLINFDNWYSLGWDHFSLHRSCGLPLDLERCCQASTLPQYSSSSPMVYRRQGDSECLKVSSLRKQILVACFLKTVVRISTNRTLRNQWFLDSKWLTDHYWAVCQVASV